MYCTEYVHILSIPLYFSIKRHDSLRPSLTVTSMKNGNLLKTGKRNDSTFFQNETKYFLLSYDWYKEEMFMICKECNGTEFIKATDFINLRPLHKRMAVGTEKIYTICASCSEVVSIKVRDTEKLK